MSLKSVDTNNNGKAFGILAHGVGAVKVSLPVFIFNKALPSPQGSGDFEVLIS